MSLISGSYSRLFCTGGATLFRDVIVEKDEEEEETEDTAPARAASIVEGALRNTDTGLMALALPTMLDRGRTFREAVLHSVRLKADMPPISLCSFSCRAGRDGTTSMASCIEEGLSYSRVDKLGAVCFGREKGPAVVERRLLGRRGIEGEKERELRWVCRGQPRYHSRGDSSKVALLLCEVIIL